VHPPAQAERLDPYYRAYACGDRGLVALACLNAPRVAHRGALHGADGVRDGGRPDPMAPRFWIITLGDRTFKVAAGTREAAEKIAARRLATGKL
jgi:hypothetical protein